MAIDPDHLPDRALFDTGVLIRALRQNKDKDSLACCELFDAMLKEKKTVLVATPTLAEIYRGLPSGTKPPPKPPHIAGVEIIAFDERAAEVVGTRLPMNVLKSTKTDSGTPLSYLKADAMIIACGVVGQATCVVALDEDHHVLAGAVGLDVRKPMSFEKAQQEQKLPPPEAK